MCTFGSSATTPDSKSPSSTPAACNTAPPPLERPVAMIFVFCGVNGAASG